MLLERPGQVVIRDELHKRLWSTDTFLDFDRGLNKAINRVRDALEDSADSPRFIETLPKRGYRFIAATEQARPSVGVDPSAGTSANAIDDVSPRNGGRRTSLCKTRRPFQQPSRQYSPYEKRRPWVLRYCC
jgi:DNA-binding winged helix-turn-helix (wHTH) protein